MKLAGAAFLLAAILIPTGMLIPAAAGDRLDQLRVGAWLLRIGLAALGAFALLLARTKLEGRIEGLRPTR
ncbi:MAG: hypothetical protein ACRD96_01700, partial [Bryobacteraceae bacterium]